MKMFRKPYNLKIVSIAVAVMLLFVDTTYSQSFSKKTLRLPVGKGDIFGRLLAVMLDGLRSDLEDVVRKAKASIESLGGNPEILEIDHINFETKSNEDTQLLIRWMRDRYDAVLVKTTERNERPVNILSLGKPLDLGEGISINSIEISDLKPSKSVNERVTRIEHVAFTYSNAIGFDVMMKKIEKAFSKGDLFHKETTYGRFKVSKKPFRIGSSGGFKPVFEETIMIEIRNDRLLDFAPIKNLRFGEISEDALEREITLAKEQNRVNTLADYESKNRINFKLGVLTNVDIYSVKEKEGSPALYFENEGDLEKDVEPGKFKKELKPKAYQVFYVSKTRGGRLEIYFGEAFLDYVSRTGFNDVLNNLVERITEDKGFNDTQGDQLQLLKLLSAIQYSLALRWNKILLESPLRQRYLHEKEENEPFPVKVPVGYDDDGLLQLDWLRDLEGDIIPLMRNMIHNTWRMWMLNDHSVHIVTVVDGKIVFGIRGKNADSSQGAVDGFAGHTALDEKGKPEIPEETALRELAEEYFGVKDVDGEEGGFIRDAVTNGELKFIHVGKNNAFANIRKLVIKEDGSIFTVPMGKENAEDWENQGTVVKVPFEPADIFLAVMIPQLAVRKSEVAITDMESGESFQAKIFEEWRNSIDSGDIEPGPSSQKLFGVAETLDPKLPNQAKEILDLISRALTETGGDITKIDALLRRYGILAVGN